MELIFLIIFNAVFFIIGGTKQDVSVWISYGFIHFAYSMLLLTPALIRKGKSSSVFGFSFFSISSTYFLIEFVTGIIFILVSPESYKAALLVQLVIACFYGILLISNIIANKYTADAEEKRHYEIAYIKDASIKLKGLLGDITDKEIKKKVERVYDAVYSSPVKSHPNLIQMENFILESINKLYEAVSIGKKESVISLANELLSTINERNIRLKKYN